MRAPGLTGTGEESPAPSAEVLLRLPGEPAFLRVARVTASGLASRMGFSMDEVDDLRLAVDELCRPLVVTEQTGPTEGRTRRVPTLVVRLRSTPAALEVEAWSEGQEVPEASGGRAVDPGGGAALEPHGAAVSERGADAGVPEQEEARTPEATATSSEDTIIRGDQPTRHPPSQPTRAAGPRPAELGDGAGPQVGAGPSSFDSLGRAILRVLVDDFGTLGRGRDGRGRNRGVPGSGVSNGLWFVKARSV